MYIFGGAVCFAIAQIHYGLYKKNRLLPSKYLTISFISLGTTVLLYAVPTFYFSEDPKVLGWFNVLANFFMYLWMAFLLAFVIALAYPKMNPMNWARALLAISIFIVIPLNIYHLPLPTFGKYGIELWNYSFPLFLATGGMILLVTGFHGISLIKHIFYEKMDKEERRSSYKNVLPLALGLMIGGAGGAIVTYSHIVELSIVGYLIMFFGGFVAILISYLK